jgi:drug/metabolite transporter (DMT)-like permease
MADERLVELRTSARGWHGVQLAVLGFIGLCGVLTGDEPSNPNWLQVLAGLLAIAALATACLATFLVASAAWPLYRGDTEARPGDLARTSRRLTTGLALTFVSVALIALSASSAWWPSDTGGDGDVQVRSASGQAWCGSLVASEAGTVAVGSAGRRVVVPIQALASVSPDGDC